MNRNRLLIAVAVTAFTYQLGSRLGSSDLLSLVPWLAIGIFCFWKAWTSPKKWGVRLGGFFIVVLAVQILLLAGYLKKVGDARFWSLVIPMAIPLIVLISCFFALSFLPEETEA